MPQSQAASIRLKPLAVCLRRLAMTASLLAVVALASACFFTPRGTEVQPTNDDVVGFAYSIAIAGASAAVASFLMGGRKRWAVELALSVVILSSIAALALVYFLWFDPMILRQRMDPWSLQRLQHGASHWAEQHVKYHGPLGAIVGISFGTLAGSLTYLGRRRPRLAVGLALIILFIAGQPFTFELVTWLGIVLRFGFLPGSISDDQISITGMILGAILGAVIANIALYVTRDTTGTPTAR